VKLEEIDFLVKIYIKMKLIEDNIFCYIITIETSLDNIIELRNYPYIWHLRDQVLIEVDNDVGLLILNNIQLNEIN